MLDPYTSRVLETRSGSPCSFTCCVTRALHLELAPDMTTDAFFQCFRRFASRRGTPVEVISDNSRTFKAANKELARIQTDPVVKDYFAWLRINGVSLLRRHRGGVVSTRG